MAKATTMGPMKIKESASYRVFKVFNAIILTLISVAMLYPFLYLVAQSFSSTQAIVAGEVGLIPKDFNISTYKYVITDGKFIPYYGNTIVYLARSALCCSAPCWPIPFPRRSCTAARPSTSSSFSRCTLAAA